MNNQAKESPTSNSIKQTSKQAGKEAKQKANAQRMQTKKDRMEIDSKNEREQRSEAEEEAGRKTKKISIN